MTIELTAEQTETWKTMMQALRDGKTWSDKSATPETIAEKKALIDNMGKGEQTEEQKTRMKTMVDGLWEKIDTEKTGSITIEQQFAFYKLMQTEVFLPFMGGYFEYDEAKIHEANTYLVGIFGTDGKLTKDQMMEQWRQQRVIHQTLM